MNPISVLVFIRLRAGEIILGFDDFNSLSRYIYLSLLGIKNVDLKCCCIYGPFTPFMGINTLSSGKISL